ncbi:MAG: RNA-directed DNA polymerase, partial [Paraclostridium sp.]
KYFKNINKDVLFNIIQSKIKCRSTLNLISNIIYADDDNGIPIGNLTSQLFANVYLNEMDMYIKHELRVKHYFRFMDDIIILDYDINNIRILYDRISKFINDKLYLKFNNKTVILSVSKGINFVGYIHYKEFKRVKSTTFKRHKKKINKIRRRYDNNNKQLDDNDRASLCSFIGHMKHADTYCLRKKLHKYFNIKFKE